MTNQHPITPPRELQDQWFYEAQELDRTSSHYVPSRYYIATQAALWGADQELEACCEEMKSLPSPLGIPFGAMASNALRAARRPKPPSDKEMALAELDRLIALIPTEGAMAMAEPIRKVLEALPND